MTISQQTTAILKEVRTIRRQIHQHPELSNQEFNTTKLIADYLDSLEIPYSVGQNGVGVIANISVDGASKTLGIRADMDALPIVEQSELPYKSTVDGIMHACGHDLHTATLLGTAKLLQKNKSDLQCNVKLLFQPAEEIMRGASDMLEAGALENPKVDAIVALHTSPDLSVGQIGVRHGAMLAASDTLEIKIKGVGGHSAHPHKCVDPIVIAGQVLTSLQTIISREIPPTDPAVISICQIQGGHAHNVIPEFVTMKGTVRNTNIAIREQMPAMIERISKNIAQSMRGDAEVTYTFGCPPLISDSHLLEHFEQVTSEIFEENTIIHMPVPSMGGEDFAFFLEHVPGFMFRIGTGNDLPNTRRALHNHMVEFDDDAIYYGVMALTHYALSFK